MTSSALHNEKLLDPSNAIVFSKCLYSYLCEPQLMQTLSICQISLYSLTQDIRYVHEHQDLVAWEI